MFRKGSDCFSKVFIYWSSGNAALSFSAVIVIGGTCSLSHSLCCPGLYSRSFFHVLSNGMFFPNVFEHLQNLRNLIIGLQTHNVPHNYRKVPSGKPLAQVGPADTGASPGRGLRRSAEAVVLLKRKPIKTCAHSVHNWPEPHPSASVHFKGTCKVAVRLTFFLYLKRMPQYTKNTCETQCMTTIAPKS